MAIVSGNAALHFVSVLIIGQIQIIGIDDVAS